MKLSINISRLTLIVALLLSMTSAEHISAQEGPLTTRIDLTCEQTFSGDITLIAQGRYKEGRSYSPLTSQEFEFYAYIKGEEQILGSSSTDNEGFARFDIKSLEGWDLDEDFYYTIGVNYEGTDQYEDNFEEYNFKRAKLKVETDDSEDKNIEIQIVEIIDGEELPVEDIEIAVAVPMMFSDLIIGSDYTDEDGMVSMIFPNDLPGGENGNISFIAKTIDADDYGVVTQSLNKVWGIPKATVIEESRSLWTPDAPLWMVATFSILMLVVWGHFIYIIYTLVKVKNDVKLNPA
ncbi:MAG: hypothetical protein HKN68_22970 [Saprospiraceae bacterium]|nr:hypothetical protein [Saprospiraceae bacterium]